MRSFLEVTVLILAMPIEAERPAIVVVNKCPIQVTNKCGPSKVRESSHNCPKCGAYQNVVNREAGGEHSHKCGRCGTEWWHADPAPVMTLPGCASGNCPAPSRGFFRR